MKHNLLFFFNQDVKNHPLKAEALFKAVLQLGEAYHMAVAEEDIDK